MSMRTSDGWSVVAKYRDGSMVKVCWPDGSESLHQVVNKSTPYMQYDMGHRYETSREESGVVVSVRGVRQWISLDGVKVIEGEIN